MSQVLVGKEVLGEMLSLARRAAYDLRATDPQLADALVGYAAEVELTVYAAAPDPISC